ncbi:MAG: HEAT repeat domain-containing protein [Oligoflexia bacterium]|nr:HEAT repeat domain-containing protein [Oligoflexia bacterium]
MTTAVQRAAPKTPFISSGVGEGDSQTLASVDLDEGHAKAEVLHCWEQLSGIEAESDAQILAKASKVFECAVSPYLRELMVDALRTSEPAIFQKEIVREAALKVLAPWVEETQIACVCVEEFQSYPKNSQSCGAASEALDQITLAADAPALETLRTTVETQLEETSRGQLSPGMSCALRAYGRFNPRGIEKYLCDSTISAITARRDSGAVLVSALAALGSPRALDLLAKIADGKLRTVKARGYSLDDYEVNQVVSWGLCGAIAGGVSGGLGLGIPTHGSPVLLLGVFAGVALGAMLSYWGVKNVSAAKESKRAWARALSGLRDQALREMARRPELPEAQAVVSKALLTHKFSPVVTEMISSLEDCHGPAATQTLMAGLDSEASESRVACVNALAAKAGSDTDVRSALGQFRSDSDAAVRAAATKALRK